MTKGDKIEINKELDYDSETLEIFNPEIIVEGSELKTNYVKNRDGSVAATNLLVLKTNVELSGDTVEEASVGFDEYGGYAVNFVLNSEGAKKFADVTGENKNEFLAIILDNIVVSYPGVRVVMR